jgi:uncharacterized membrane protein YvlD (DUF360 family)
MIRFIARLLLTAAVFAFILPMIPGIDFHGNFGAAIVAALVFGILGWLVDLVAKLVTGILTITTLGLGLLVLIPLWILGFWILPAVALRLVADAMPNYVHVHGWIPAIEGGLVMLVLGAVTSQRPKMRN